MGNTSFSSPSTSLLRERDAWAVATTWHKILCSVVRFRSEYPILNDAATGIPWIVFAFDTLEDNDTAFEQAATAAREAMLAWAALQRCHGFSVYENAQFWQRVFSELGHARSKRPSSSTGDGDDDTKAAAELFDREVDGGFPVVRLELNCGRENVVLRAFLSPLSAPPLSLRFRTAMAMLQPFVRSDGPSSPIALLVNSMRLPELHNVPNWRQSRDLDLITSENGPRFQLHAVRLRREEMVNDSNVAVLFACPGVSFCVPTVDSALSATNLHRLVDGLLMLDPSNPIQIQIGQLRLHDGFAAWCSALPRIRSIQQVVVDRTDSRSGQQVDKLDVAWLGYALFSPRGAVYEGSFSNLVLDLNMFDKAAIQTLMSMAQGNNLLWAIGSSGAPTTGYNRTKIRAGASILQRPVVGCDDVVVSLATDQWVTLCESSSSGRTWVRVAVPGRGIGWVKSEEIVERLSPISAECSVRRLRVSLPYTPLMTELTARLMDLLSVVGSELTYLDVATDNSLCSTDIHSILGQCPRLKTLLISHDGSYWSTASTPSSEPVQSSSPQLEELELRLAGQVDEQRVWLEDKLQPLLSPQLDSLCVLHVTTSVSSRFEDNRKAFLSVLAQYPRLQHVHWTCSGTEPRSEFGIPRPRISVADHRYAARRLLGIVRGVHDVALVPLTYSSRVAFLSCIRHHRRTTHSSPLNRIGPDIGPEIVRLVFEFCSGFAPRQIFIRLDREIPSWGTSGRRHS